MTDIVNGFRSIWNEVFQLFTRADRHLAIPLFYSLELHISGDVYE